MAEKYVRSTVPGGRDRLSINEWDGYHTSSVAVSVCIVCGAVVAEPEKHEARHKLIGG